jgi:hypothetical protein
LEEMNQRASKLRRHDEAKLVGRANRSARTKVHDVIPNHFFSAASSECRDVFIDGYFYACVSLAQAVAEGLSGYLGRLHKVGAKNDPQQRVERLCNKGFISAAAQSAFHSIWSNDRNAFHHMNEDIPTEHQMLERRAEECVMALLKIESELFAFDIDEGRIIPKNPIYWPEVDAEHFEVFLRLSGY